VSGAKIVRDAATGAQLAGVPSKALLVVAEGAAPEGIVSAVFNAGVWEPALMADGMRAQRVYVDAAHPPCGHSSCAQAWIEAGESECHHEDETIDQLREKARAQWASEDLIIDPDAQVDDSPDDGAWVTATVWVSKGGV
jgi:hypothetical protein